MYARILSNFAMHISLDETETDLVIGKLQRKAVQKNEVLLDAGSVCRYLFHR